MKRLILSLTIFLLLIIVFIFTDTRSSASKLKDIQFKGYITEVHSPTYFLVDDYRITVENVRDIELENIESKAVKFDPVEQIKVGTFIKVKGKYDSETLETTVTEVKIDMKQFRNLSATVVLASKPQEITRLSNGKWTGVVTADARKIIINESTDVRFKLNKSEEKAEKEEQKKAEKEAKTTKKDGGKNGTEPPAAEPSVDETVDSERDSFDKEDDLKDVIQDSKPLQTLEQIGPGVYLTYKGKESSGGSLIAETIVFVRNEKTKQEKNVWKKLRLKEKDAKDAKSFAKLKVGDDDYKVIQDKEVQDYIQRLADSLIPDYQRQLSDDDDNKIPFHFVVVYKEGLNAACYPTGTAVINHELFNQLENEAQLVFVLSHEIAHATQEHTVREMNHNKKRRTGLLVGSIFASAMGYHSIGDLLKYTEIAMKMGYARTVENQADRMGLANMIAHGYDPRQAPRTWKLFSLVEGGDSQKYFWSSHDSNTERRSFLWLTIHNTYPNLDFTNLKRDSEEFHRIALIINEKYPSKKKRKAATP